MKNLWISVQTAVCFLAILLCVPLANGFEIITEENIVQNIVTREMLIPTADNFIILYDASGSMAEEYRDGVLKIDAEQQILKQQNKILPNLAYNAGLYSYTPFKAYYDMQPYDRQAFGEGIMQLPNTKTAGGFADQPTPLAEGIAALDPILADLSGKTVASFSPTAPTPTIGSPKNGPWRRPRCWRPNTTSATT